MKDIAIFGAGGFGRETALMIQQINQHQRQWNLVGFFDDGAINEVDGLPVLGGIHELNSWTSPMSVAIAIAHPPTRKNIVQSLHNSSLDYPTLFHPSCNRGSAANSFGRGCIVTAGCVLTLNVHLKDFVIVNLLTTIGHDVTIGNFTAIMPNCSLSGFTSIGDNCFIGAGARVLQKLIIGQGATVGAGAVVIKDVEAGTTVGGVPAQKIY